MISSFSRDSRQKAVWGPKRTFGAALLLLVGLAPSAAAAGSHNRQAPSAKAASPNAFTSHNKLDRRLADRSVNGPSNETTPVVVTFTDGQLPAEFKSFVAAGQGKLGIVNGYALSIPNRLLNTLSANPKVVQFHVDRPLSKQNLLTSLTTGARVIQTAMGATGAGVGVAVIDSGITTWHDDLTNRSTRIYTYGNQRVTAFVDFVNGRTSPYDDDGHGTHVSGIIAGNGYDSNGQKAGMAPDASLVSLKVLDANGQGRISNVIAALDWVLANHHRYNIRVVNLSVSAAVTESYWTDPLTLAAKQVVDAGVVVVTAAGNRGLNALGQPQYGGIGAPGNAPWVITVGASSTNGTANRNDDTMATFSSRGPTYLDWSAKPDLVAPGTGTVSLAASASTLVTQHPEWLLSGLLSTGVPPYLSLSGTSMAAPVVSGVIAQMLQVNPNLTPNAVKAILQYTAQVYPGYNSLTEGAGFLNAIGAVRLAQFFSTAKAGDPVPTQNMWSKHLVWGNHVLSGGMIKPSANAFAIGTIWGSAQAVDGHTNIVWGTAAAGPNNIVWGTSCASNDCDNVVWGTADGDDNIVWGTDCGGADCDNVVWGTADGDDNIVWGTALGTDNIVWGTLGASNIVWGTALGDDNIVWGTAFGDDNIVWGTALGDDNIVWGTAINVPTSWTTAVLGSLTQITAATLSRMTDDQAFAAINAITSPPPQGSPGPPSLFTMIMQVVTNWSSVLGGGF